MGILTSKDSDEEISAKLVEILGYTELELVTNIVQQRRNVIETVSLFMSSRVLGPI